MIEFSVLMGVYIKDRPKWVSEALDSMLNQTVKPSEILIVQDGPITKELEETIEKYINENSIVKLIKFEQNRGVGATMQDAVPLAKYDYIARMDSDDISVKERFEKEIKFLEENPDYDGVGSVVIEFEDGKNPFESTIFRNLPETNEEIIKWSKGRCPLQQSTVMLKKEAILKAGGYREFYLVEDYDLFIRMISNGSKFYNFQEPLTYMRINKDFFNRRGGLKYYKSIHKFKKYMYQSGHITYMQYLKTNTASLIVCLMPGFLRTYIYKKLLRKKKKGN
ncbi:glycosyltransferase [Acholeplasma equirhinis]|uniref:glycosyltransferase n=1 Tax=Acholeplasma equirhinis TaxID=555393 RepID=UPI00197A7951|nr:glycosyltransferase [Acholeplasma equirhinis]MBN3489995.1 glycosyltransferase [Acholeplasma equirhinis]